MIHVCNSGVYTKGYSILQGIQRNCQNYPKIKIPHVLSRVHSLTLIAILQNRSYCIFFSTGAFDPKSKKFNKNDIFAAIMGLLIYQSSCEQTAVNGVRAFADLTDFEMKHQAFWKVDDRKRFAEIMNVR